MKKSCIIIHMHAIILITLIITPAMAAEPLHAEKNTKGWAAKVGKEVITINDFNRFYYTQNKMINNVEKNEEIDKLADDPDVLKDHPYLNKEFFLETLINGKLVFAAAKDDKSIDQAEMNTLIELSKYQVVMQYYLVKKLKAGITVTDEEIDQFYEKYQDQFAGYTINDARELCRKEIEKQKLYKEMNKYLEELKQKRGVDRDGFKEYMSGK